MTKTISFDQFRQSQTLPARRRGSCRFAPYYKAQWYDESTLAWRDIAERFSSEANARLRFAGAKQWRVMEVSMAGRNVL